MVSLERDYIMAISSFIGGIMNAYKINRPQHAKLTVSVEEFKEYGHNLSIDIIGNLINFIDEEKLIETYFCPLYHTEVVVTRKNSNLMTTRKIFCNGTSLEHLPLTGKKDSLPTENFYLRILIKACVKYSNVSTKIGLYLEGVSLEIPTLEIEYNVIEGEIESLNENAAEELIQHNFHGDDCLFLGIQEIFYSNPSEEFQNETFQLLEVDNVQSALFEIKKLLK